MMRTFIGFGSSIDPERNILRALDLLSYTEKILKISNFYQNQAVNRPKDPPFWNGAVSIETSCSPWDLKYSVLRKVESECGRIRIPDSYSPNPLDLDILLYDDKVILEKEMVIPHPDIRSKPFIALPIYETSPLMILPDTGESLSEILKNMDVSGLKCLQRFSNKLQMRFPKNQENPRSQALPGNVFPEAPPHASSHSRRPIANETFQHHRRGIFS